MSAGFSSTGGNLENASGALWSRPGFHCRTKSYSISWRAHLWSFGLRSRLLNGNVSAAQSVTNVNLRPARYVLKCPIAQSTAKRSRSVGPLFPSLEENLRLAKALWKVSSPITWSRTAPAPTSDASVLKVNGWFQSGNARIVGADKAVLI